MALNEIEQYTKTVLDKKISVVETNGPKIQKCLEYAMDKLTDYHNEGARGAIVDKAFFELYAKIESALVAYKKYDSRVRTNLASQIDALNTAETAAENVPQEDPQEEDPQEKEKSSVPRRSSQN